MRTTAKDNDELVGTTGSEKDIVNVWNSQLRTQGWEQMTAILARLLSPGKAGL